MELIIKYRAGVITIHIENFLERANLKDFKKLLKIIDKSDTPEARDVLKDYIREYLQTSNKLFNENKAMPVGWFNDTCKKRKRYTRFLNLLNE